MGICLDTDQQDGSQVFEDDGAQNTERWRREAGILATPPGGNFPMQNSGPVKFESPSVPVIFVLGGPGSGKVTHCDHLTQEKKGIVHINMTDLLQQYALGNEMQDFGLLSSKTVTEVLMLEMKMSPGAKTFLVSGYPRNMRDVVEYSEKIQIVNGVILVAWKQEVLERQIDYGAQLGQVIIELARMELENFYKHVMPAADYFDQCEMLLVVNGERNPSEVYVDFREAVMRILGLSDDGSAPRQRQVSSSMEAEVEVEREQDGREPSPTPTEERIVPPPPSESPPPPVIGEEEILPSKTADIPRKRLPPIVWVLGGPGSNKALVCSQAIRKMTNWVHLSVGSLLVTQAASSPMIHEALKSGEMVPTEVVELLVEKQILLNRNCNGIVIDGFPRDLTQARDFENKYGQRPEMLLLDVSKQHVNRGRLYDGAEAFERRLELFRKLSLPMLKNLDAQGRLSIVDGDTELPVDRQQFASALLELMRRASRHEDDPNRISVIQSELEDEEKVQEATPAQPPPQPPPSNKIRPAAQANGVAKPIGNGVGHRNNNPAVIGNGAAGGRAKPPVQANGGIGVTASRVSNARKAATRWQSVATHQNGQPPKKPIATITNNYNNNNSQPRKPTQNHANGGPPQLIQNGVPARMGNGFLPKPNNRVGPVALRQNGSVVHPADPLRRMYSEIDDLPPTNLHM